MTYKQKLNITHEIRYNQKGKKTNKQTKNLNIKLQLPNINSHDKPVKENR